jgi:hypothetical protein
LISFNPSSSCLFSLSFVTERLNSILNRFLLDVKDVTKNPAAVATMMYGIRYIQFDLTAGTIKASNQFVDLLNKNFKAWMKKGEHRLAIAEATGFILNSAVGLTAPPGTDGDEWKTNVTALWTNVLALAKKVKKSWQIVPLQIVLLCMQQEKIFTTYCETLVNSLLEMLRDPAMRQLALESLYRVLFAYFHKFNANTQSGQHTKFLFASLTQHLYPTKTKPFVPSRPCIDTFVDIIDLLAMKHYETVIKNFINEYIVVRDPPNPEPVIIGLISFMGVSNRHRLLKSPETESLLVGHVTSNKSVGYYRFRKESLFVIGEKEAPKYASFTTDLAQLNTTLLPAYHLADTHVGEFSKIKPQKGQLEMILRDKVYFVDLLRCFLYACRRTIPIGISSLDFLAIICKYTLHIYDGIVDETFQLLTYLMETRPLLRGGIISQLCRVVANIPDSHIALSRGIVTKIVGLMKHWRGILNKTVLVTEEQTAPCEKIDKTEFVPHEVEGVALVLLCHTDQQTRRLALELLKYVSVFCEALGGFTSTRVYSIISNNGLELINRAHEFRASIQQKPLSPTRRKDDSVEAFLARRQVREDDFLWARLLGHLASRSSITCREATSHAWRILTARLTTLFPLIESGKDITEERLNAWRNYVCFGVAACFTEDTKQIPTVPEGAKDVLSAIHSSRDLYRVIVLFLGSDNKNQNEPVETAVTFVFPGSFPMLAKEFQQSEAIAYPEGEKHVKQRKKSQLRLMTSLSYVYRVAIENCQKGSLSEPFYNLLFKEFIRVLEMQVGKFPAVLPGDNPGDVYFLRYNINCLLTRLVQEANNGPTDKKKTLAEKGMHASLLFQYAMDCSTCGPNSAEIYEAEDPLIATYLASNPEFKEDVAQVRLSATRALAELLTTPLADKEESIVFIYHDNLFRKGIPAMQLEGEKGLINIVKSNPEKIEKYSKEYLLRCYADRMISAGYFQALTEMIIEGTSTSTTLPAALQLALYKLGDPREEIRNTASRLIHAICRIHFNSAYYPVETNTQTYNTYQTSQVLVACNFARDHAEITLEFFDECLARLRLVDVLARDRLLRYLNPWLKNIRLLANQTSILDRLVIVTVKYGVLYSNTVRNLWLTISSIPGNLEVILNYLVQKAVDDKNVGLIYMAQKIAVILFSEHPQRTVDFLMERIQISDFTTDTIEDSVAFQSKNLVTPQEAFSAVMANPIAAEQWEIEQILPFCSQEVTFSTTNIAVFMLCDLLLQKKSDEFVGHLPVLLQIGVLGLDDPSLLVADFSKTLLANVTYCLAAKTPASAEAYTLATEISNAAKNNKRYWRHENATTDHFNLDSAVQLGVLVKRLTSVLAEQTNITEKWSTESLRWISESSSPHTASRCLQIYRTLNEPVSQAGLTAIISCLYKHFGERTNEVTLGVEVLLTLDVLIESTETVDALQYPQLFWTTVAYLHSDHQAEFLMALDLLKKMIEKYNFANDSNVSDVLLADEVVPKNWGDATFQGVQPLLLRGLMSEATAPKTIALLIELSPLLASHQVFCVDQAVGAIDNILGLLPWLLFNFGSKETVNYASSLAISLQTLGYSDLAVCYHRYTQSEFSTNNEFLISLFTNFEPFHPKHYLRILAILNEMLEKGPPKYQRTVLQILGSYVMSSGITASDIRKKIMSVFLHISNRLSGPLWDEVLPILDTTLALHGSTLNNFPLIEDSSPYDLTSMKPSATWKDKQSKKRLTASTQQILETMHFSVTPLAVGQVSIDEDDAEPAVSFHLPSTSSSVLPFDWATKRDTIRVFIPTFETWGDQQKFSVYKVVVQSGGIRWKAYRRYNEFHQLHDQLALEFNPLPKMPPKKIIGNNLSQKFVEGRRAKLQAYMKEVVENFPTIFNNKYFQGFCDVINPKSPSLGVFASIPEATLLKIFGYLSLRDLGFAVASTCKYWQRMGEDDTLWNRITLSTFTLNHPLACETWKLQYKECKAKPPASRAGPGGPAGGPTGPKVNLTPVQLRQEAIDEIVSTERDYVTALDTCISVSSSILFSYSLHLLLTSD